MKAGERLSEVKHENLTDNKGRQWRVSVTGYDNQAGFCDLTGIDLMGICDGTLQKLAGDPIALVDVFYAVVHPQAMENKVDDNEFADGIGGDCIQAGLDVLMTELTIFSQPRRNRVCTGLGGAEASEAKAINQAMSSRRQHWKTWTEGTNQA